MSLTRINLLLAALVAALVLVAWLGPGPEGLRLAPGLTELDPGSVRHIRVRDRNGLRLEAQRTVDGWHLLHPFQGPADAIRLEALARIAQAPSQRRIPSEEVDPEAMGLNRSTASLELDGLLLELGATEPVNRRRYVRVGHQVHLIDDLFQHLLLADPASFLAQPAPR